MPNDMNVAGNQFPDMARGAALVRALAAIDEREEIRGKDTLAEIFLADDRKNSINDPAMREWLMKNYIPNGVYAYTIARTAYFDHIVEQGLREGLPQIVILGAGYDSRPYRFADLLGETRIFEVDEINTLQRKQKLLQQADIPIPGNLAYVQLSYEPALLRENLAGAGFDVEKPVLFIWEGATYYLKPDEVDKVLRFMGAEMPAGSAVCFDYNAIPSRSTETDAGDELPETMGAQAGVNPEQFGIEEGKTGIFLAERDFMILEHLEPGEMERMFLTLRDGSSVGKVPARHRIVYASLSK